MSPQPLALAETEERAKKKRFPMFASFALAYLPALCLLAAVGLQSAVPAGFITRDPAAITNQPFYLGLVSQIGLLLWGAAATLCLFSSALLRPVPEARESSAFLAASGLFLLALLADDLLLLHEQVFPAYLGVPERAVLLGYGALACAYALRFRRVLRTTERLPLLLAALFFAAAVGMDFLEGRVLAPETFPYLLEDGAKLLGIVSITLYFARTCASLLTGAHGARP